MKGFEGREVDVGRAGGLEETMRYWSRRIVFFDGQKVAVKLFRNR